MRLPVTLLSYAVLDWILYQFCVYVRNKSTVSNKSTDTTTFSWPQGLQSSRQVWAISSGFLGLLFMAPGIRRDRGATRWSPPFSWEIDTLPWGSQQGSAVGAVTDAWPARKTRKLFSCYQPTSLSPSGMCGRRWGWGPEWPCRFGRSWCEVVPDGISQAPT